MRLPAHEFVKPASLAEGLAVLASAPPERAKVLAGGTDVIYNMRGKLFRPDVLLSVRDLPELQSVSRDDDGTLHLGAVCRLADLERHPSVQQYPALATAFRSVASRHVRNMATLGGNLCLDTRCWYTNQSPEWREAKGACLKTGVDVCHAIKPSQVCVAINASDTAPALIALDAVVTLASADGQREVALAEFFTSDGIAHTVRRPNEIMTAVTVPPTDDRLVYAKETARKGNDFSYGSIAARADGEATSCTRACIVIGSLSTRPVVLERPSRIIAEQGLGNEAIDAAVAATRDELGILTNLYSPAAYKSQLARTLVRRALEAVREVGND